jgi:membrane fusion protein (multidrug efflux system)
MSMQVRERGRGLGAGLAMIALLVLSGWTDAASGDDTGVPVATVELELAPHTLTLPDKVAILEAATSLDLSFEVSGRVERILDQGARVEKDAVIAVLDNDLEAAEVRRTSLLLQEARSDLERARGLRKSSAASESALEVATTAVGLRRAERDAALERRDRRQLRARFAGVVAEVDIEPGEVTVPGGRVARLLDFDVMKLEVGVTGTQMRRVSPGAAVDVRVPALPGRSFAGRVHHIAPSAANSGALFELEIHVPNAEGLLKPGMSARASITTRVVAEALTLPLQTSVLRDDARVVFFVSEGRAHTVDVSDAILHGDRLVLGSPGPYRTLVVRGQHGLRDGVPVRVDNAILAGQEAAPAGEQPAVTGP